MKFRYIALAAILATLLCACSHHDAIPGKWLLVDFCFDDDCTHLADYGIEQLWTLDDDVAFSAHDDNGKTRLRYQGRQFQQGTMDTPIRWWLSSDKDTLFTVDTSGRFMDTMCVRSLRNDTLVLVKQDNNRNVLQLFVRQ
ncbi:MAG: hypothetical protein K5864_00160 [Bacteroidales bacterium]|nr:hypothetical protein [Bacteroidales bacterium]